MVTRTGYLIIALILVGSSLAGFAVGQYDDRESARAASVSLDGHHGYTGRYGAMARRWLHRVHNI